MKSKERKFARQLRQSGCSIRDISRQIKCSKGSVSKWVRDIPLTAKQIDRLRSNQDKGRAKAANHPNSLKQVWSQIRNDIINSAAREIPSHFSFEILRIVGSALYWAEGSKSEINMVSFSNSDPWMIGLMVQFFKRVCKVPSFKFRGAVHIHPHQNPEKAKKYWSKVSEIPLGQFHKTQIATSIASKNKKDNLPLGTFRIVICDVRLQSRIKGWIEGMKYWANSSVG